MANKTIYVRDEKLWAEFKAYAQFTNTSISKLLMDAVEIYMNLAGSRRKRIMQRIRCEPYV